MDLKDQRRTLPPKMAERQRQTQTGTYLLIEYGYRLPRHLLSEEELSSEDPDVGLVRVKEYGYVRPRPQLSSEEEELMRTQSEHHAKVRAQRQKQRQLAADFGCQEGEPTTTKDQE